ncbi:hypothetical protein CLV62_1253 [Dysgonomonas alginatilytica]|uniref:Uncharacterized protein n=1 Tax=Dysgonomonas alginatilytica TaxID=1605892 RepID=A0A2V3PMP8_9BACT|nr:hypothetical protein [Dysgonomonas alginatilytica]PXV61170.1 hypothetical protein CLV62_1253 [Dysgonomonas alginatilytica]
MTIVYKKCVADGGIPEYMCDPCVNAEHGRVRSVAFIDKSLKDLLEAVSGTPGTKNVESKTWWETQIQAGLIIVVPTTRGTYDGGTPNMVTGFGDKKEMKSSKTHVTVFNDPNHTGNDDFYQSLEDNAENFLLAWRTESELRVANETLSTVDAKDAVEEDIDSFVVWSVTCTWDQRGSKKNVPIYNLGEVKDVFYCIDEEGSTP